MIFSTTVACFPASQPVSLSTTKPAIQPANKPSAPFHSAGPLAWDQVMPLDKGLLSCITSPERGHPGRSLITRHCQSAAHPASTEPHYTPLHHHGPTGRVGFHRLGCQRGTCKILKAPNCGIQLWLGLAALFVIAQRLSLGRTKSLLYILILRPSLLVNMVNGFVLRSKDKQKHLSKYMFKVTVTFYLVVLSPFLYI